MTSLMVQVRDMTPLDGQQPDEPPVLREHS